MARGGRARAARSGNFALDRRTLMVDVEQQKANEEVLARRAEAERKNEETERWNGAVDKLKAAAQQVIDGTLTAAEYEAQIKDAQKSFPSKAGLLDANLKSVVRAGDTQRFNDYASGAITFKDLKKYASDRADLGGGDQDHLKQLLAKAQTDEDTRQYNDYIKDGQSYADWQKYAAGRLKDGGDLTNLQTLVAQAQNNEAKASDRREQISYQSGLTNGPDYKRYLDGRISSATNPNDLNALRAEKQAVDKNEFVKSVNEITNAVESGRYSPSEAVTQLRGLLGTTTDEGLKKEVLNRIASYQAKAAAGGNGSATQARIQTQINEMATKAVGDFKDSRTAVLAQLKDGGDYKSASDAMNLAFDRLQAGLVLARDGSANNGENGDASQYAIFLAGQNQERSTTLKGLAIAGANGAAAKISTSATANPVLAAQTRAKYLFDATQDPNISRADKQGMITEATSGLETAVTAERSSEAGRNAATFVQNRVDEIVSHAGEGGVKDLAAKMLGVNSADLPAGWEKNANVIKALGTAVHDKLNSNPGDLYTAFNQAGLKDFVSAQSATNPNGEFPTRDSFTKAWNAVNGGLTGEAAMNAALFGAPGHAGLSPYEQALAQTAGPATALEQARWDAKAAEAGDWRTARALAEPPAYGNPPAAKVNYGSFRDPAIANAPPGRDVFAGLEDAAGAANDWLHQQGKGPFNRDYSQEAAAQAIADRNAKDFQPPQFTAAPIEGSPEQSALDMKPVQQLQGSSLMAGNPMADLAFTPTPQIELSAPPAPDPWNTFDPGVTTAPPANPFGGGGGGGRRE